MYEPWQEVIDKAGYKAMIDAPVINTFSSDYARYVAGTIIIAILLIFLYVAWLYMYGKRDELKKYITQKGLMSNFVSWEKDRR